MTHDNVLPIASVPCGITPGPIELRRVETFTGAACCQPIELQSYKSGSPLGGPGHAQPADAERTKKQNTKAGED